MNYLGKDIPKLGFGLMRLPMLGGEVDIEQTKEMVDLFLKKGFKYFDTAYGYIGGKSEEAVKAALVDRYPRESFYLATKLPAWYSEVKTAEDAKKMFFTSLKRTGAGYFDFYLLHNLGGDRTDVFDKYGIWDFVMEQKEKGLIKHIGFSMHDKAASLDKVLREHPEVEFIQLQINYADWENPTVESRKCYEVALKHNKPIIIMEPIKGGNLMTLPDQIKQIFTDANPQASTASWAVRFAASLDNVITVLSGMSTIEQMKDNVSYMEHFEPLNSEEHETVNKVREALDAVPTIPCTSCGYCMKGCPQNVVIPDIFSAMNSNTLFGNLRSARGSYMWATKDGGKASACIECAQCEAVCPQNLEIIKNLKEAAGLLE